MCLFPRLMFNPKYKANKKNGGEIPTVFDDRVLYVPVGCGTCIECRKQKARDWQVRLTEDIKAHKNARFITLTFSNHSIKQLVKQDYKILKHSKFKFAKPPYRYIKKVKKRNQHDLTKLKGYDLDNGLAIKAIRLFLERWRKKYGTSVRHWLITELGHEGTENVHLHGIIYCTDEQLKNLDSIWQYGYVWKGYTKLGVLENYVNGRTINYIIKYVSKIDEKHLNYKPVVLCTQGIGSNFKGTFNKYDGDKTLDHYRLPNGKKISLPIYYRNKIYSDDNREKLWIQKLDKNERYICGEKIPADDLETYNKLVNWHRERTKKLGYPPPEFIYKQKQYEERRRELIHKRRIE